MPLFWICCVCLLLFLPTGDSEQVVTSVNNMCSKNDCSYEVHDFMNDICKVYNASVCLDFYKFEESSEETLTSEGEFNFHVSVVPYAAEFFVTVDNIVYPPYKYPAINITFTVNNDIDELVVKIYAKNVSTKEYSTPVCRIFDLRDVNNSTNVKFPINFSYDCFDNMSQEYGFQNVRMDFIALPVEEKQSYYVFIPEYPGDCEWQPLIMVFRGNLHNGVVQVNFSQAPELYNVSDYIIKLTHLSGGEKTLHITPDESRKMLFVQFTSVDGGAYSVSVEPVFSGKRSNCATKTDVFLIEKPTSDHMWTIYLCIFILLIFSAFVFLKMFRRNISKFRFGSKRQILLVYSHDSEVHADFVAAFIQYMIKHCHVEVSTIYDELPINWNPDEKLMNVILNLNECNPQEWIMKKYNECDIIMFLISAGLFYTLDSLHFRPIQKYHEWRNQLRWAKNLILNEQLNNEKDVKSKKICKVCFPYSKREPIPNTLMIGFGECYVLPQEMNNLINFMHDSGECFWCRKLCVTNFESSFIGTDLYEKMEAIQKAVDNNSHCHFINDTAMNDSNFSVENDNIEEISTTSCSSDENSDAFNDMLSGSVSKFNSKEIFESVGNSDSEELDLLDIDEPVSDSDSEESFIFNQTNQKHFIVKNEAKDVIEHILNMNST